VSHAALSLMLAIACVSCSDAVAPASSSLRFTDNAPNVIDPASNNGGATASAAGSYGVVVIVGRIILPSPCYALSPHLQRTGNALSVTISATSTSQLCAGVIDPRNYSLRISDLAAGVYHVRVYHDIAGLAQQPELVLERDVQVE
jgi:hypothetical protein